MSQQKTSSRGIRINEIYLSVQGESTFAGEPCIFIRTTGCPLRCSYCDTAYAFTEGSHHTLEGIMSSVRNLTIPFRQGKPIVEITGGEPLIQSACLDLLTLLCDDGYTVLLETSGAFETASVDIRVHKILDLKCPGSGENEAIHWANLESLCATDEIKFVIAAEEDYEWAKDQVLDRELHRLCPVLFSWASPLSPNQRDKSLKPFPLKFHGISRRDLVARILADGLPVKFQLQLHKVIWDPSERSV